MLTPKLHRRTILEATKKLRAPGAAKLRILEVPMTMSKVSGAAARKARIIRGAGVYTTVLLGKARRQEGEKEVVPLTLTEKTAEQVSAEREKRRQGLRMLMGLNTRREGGPVDGLQFQEEQRAAW